MDVRLQLAEQLAVELRRHGLDRHLAQLRGYYAATRAGRAGAWSDDHVRLLATVLQVVPGVEVRPRGSGCCEGFLSRTAMNIADRVLVQCSGCGRRWLVLLPEAVAA